MFNDLIKDKYVKRWALFSVGFFVLGFLNLFVTNTLMAFFMFGMTGWVLCLFNAACNWAEERAALN